MKKFSINEAQVRNLENELKKLNNLNGEIDEFLMKTQKI